MADGRDPTYASNSGPTYSWAEIFRCAKIAMWPRKLFVAAVGILVMSFLWWLLSVSFWYKAPDRQSDDYSTGKLQREFGNKKKPGTEQNYTEEDFKRIADERHARDLEQWKVLDSLAGPGGRLRTLPWYEYRGPNPFLFVTTLVGASPVTWWEQGWEYVKTVAPVLLEPLVKLLLPVAKIFSPDVSPQTRVYLFLILLSSVAIWAFCGGIITRIAAIELANKGPISLRQATRFVWNRYLAYIGAPVVPLLIIAACVVGLFFYGLVGLIPFIGDLLVLGAGLPVIIIGGAVMAVFLVGLVGYPLMYPTLSADGDQSDTFDALSRSINYVYQSPWQYIWYWLVAILYGAAVTFFVLFFTSLTVYVGKWAVGIPAGLVWSERKPEYLFIYTPESFGWKALLTADSPYAVHRVPVMLDRNGKETTNPAEAVRTMYVYKPVDEAAYKQARGEFYVYNTWGAGIVCFWLTLIFLMMLGFSYSFFWCAATMIYLLMRRRVDEAELDEVFTEDEEPEPPLAPPKIAEGTGPAAPTSLPVITPPVVPMPPMPPPTVSPPPPPPPPPVVFSPPPPPPAVLSPPPPIPFSPPPPLPEPSPPKAADEPKTDEPKKKDDDSVPLG
jgi:hypothetical protein